MQEHIQFWGTAAAQWQGTSCYTCKDPMLEATCIQTGMEQYSVVVPAGLVVATPTCHFCTAKQAKDLEEMDATQKALYAQLLAMMRKLAAEELKVAEKKKIPRPNLRQKKLEDFKSEVYRQKLPVEQTNNRLHVVV